MARSRFCLMLSPNERAQLKYVAKMLGISVAEFMRTASIEKARKMKRLAKTRKEFGFSD